MKLCCPCRSLMETKLKTGTTLIVDRYSYSGVAFSSAKGLDIEWCKVKDLAWFFSFIGHKKRVQHEDFQEVFHSSLEFTYLCSLNSQFIFCRSQRSGCQHQMWQYTLTYLLRYATLLAVWPVNSALLGQDLRQSKSCFVCQKFSFRNKLLSIRFVIYKSMLIFKKVFLCFLFNVPCLICYFYQGGSRFNVQISCAILFVGSTLLDF